MLNQKVVSPRKKHVDTPTSLDRAKFEESKITSKASYGYENWEDLKNKYMCGTNVGYNPLQPFGLSMWT